MVCRSGAAFGGIQLGAQLQATRQGLVFEGMWQMRQVMVRVRPRLRCRCACTCALTWARLACLRQHITWLLSLLSLSQPWPRVKACRGAQLQQWAPWAAQRSRQTAAQQRASQVCCAGHPAQAQGVRPGGGCAGAAPGGDRPRADAPQPAALPALRRARGAEAARRALLQPGHQLAGWLLGQTRSCLTICRAVLASPGQASQQWHGTEGTRHVAATLVSVLQERRVAAQHARASAASSTRAVPVMRPLTWPGWCRPADGGSLAGAGVVRGRLPARAVRVGHLCWAPQGAGGCAAAGQRPARPARGRGGARGPVRRLVRVRAPPCPRKGCCAASVHA